MFNEKILRNPEKPFVSNDVQILLSKVYNSNKKNRGYSTLDEIAEAYLPVVRADNPRKFKIILTKQLREGIKEEYLQKSNGRYSLTPKGLSVVLGENKDEVPINPSSTFTITSKRLTQQELYRNYR
jgi:hypothetical protein